MTAAVGLHRSAENGGVTGIRLRTRASAGLAVLLVLLSGVCAVALLPETRAPAPRSTLVPLRVDPNTASAEELMLLPGVGPAIARNIIEYRASAAGGASFKRPVDLDRVPRIGPATIERLAPFLTFPHGSDQTDDAEP